MSIHVLVRLIETPLMAILVCYMSSNVLRQSCHLCCDWFTL